MMSMTCQIGRTGLDLVACGCSSNALIHKYLVKNRSKGAFWSGKNGYGARELLCFRLDITRTLLGVVFFQRKLQRLLSMCRGCISSSTGIGTEDRANEPNFTSEIV